MTPGANQALPVEKFFPQLDDGFARLLAEAMGRTIAVLGHARPDGDCIGAQVALARILRSRGVDAVCVNPDPVPRRLEFLARDTAFIRTDEMLARPSGASAIFVDCADGTRPGERLKARFPEPLGNIDHHLSNAGYAAVNLVDSGSAATCEILAGLALDLGLPIDPPSARALYTGILTDTGQFRFPSTTRRCFVLAGELVAHGADPAEAGYELYERESHGKLQLLQRFLASLRMECAGRVCVGVLPAGVFKATGTTAEDTEGFVDYARSIEGVDIGVLIEEREDGSVKASLRSKEAVYRVDLAAAEFGGGGHACAAGLKLNQATADFPAKLLNILKARLKEGDRARAS